jgi:rod shape-determining protein MreB and related proteins
VDRDGEQQGGRLRGRAFGALVGGPDVAIDLGTANTLVYLAGRGIVVDEPSVVAIDAASGEVHAVGLEAERMVGRTPATISAIRPLRHGVIADFEVTEQMLRQFLRRVLTRRLARPRLVVCAPSGITDVEKRALRQAARGAGAREMHLIEEPVAAAIGAGVPIEEPVGRMIVDVGGGTSEVAVISLGGMVTSRSVRVGGYELDDAILDFVRTEHRLSIGSRSAELLKHAIGSAGPWVEASADVRGRDLITGLPRQLTLTSAEIRAAIEQPLREIVGAVKDTLEDTPPELASDIVRDGILLAGGGSLLHGFERRVHEETGIESRRVEDPLTCVARGAGLFLDELDSLGRRPRVRV